MQWLSFFRAALMKAGDISSSSAIGRIRRRRRKNRAGHRSPRGSGGYIIPSLKTADHASGVIEIYDFRVGRNLLGRITVDGQQMAPRFCTPDTIRCRMYHTGIKRWRGAGGGSVPFPIEGNGSPSFKSFRLLPERTPHHRT